jgi:very-short-patch-repair endonuclease
LSDQLTPVARRLRRDSTDAEKRLWGRLRAGQLNGLVFRRQEPIGSYVVDFVCTCAKLVVEVDGGQHADNANDVERDAFLRDQGFRVLRVWNNDVMSNLDGVLQRIAEVAPEQ